MQQYPKSAARTDAYHPECAPAAPDREASLVLSAVPPPLLVVEVAVAADDIGAARSVVHVDIDLGLDLVVHACRLRFGMMGGWEGGREKDPRKIWDSRVGTLGRCLRNLRTAVAPLARTGRC